MFGKIEYKLLIENYMTKDEYKKIIEEYMDKYTISYANATQLIMSTQIERFGSKILIQHMNEHLYKHMTT
jgi:hypothetical protein